MKRSAIAAAWLLGTTVPVLGAAVFLFGCCVLPFHQLMHRIPLCHLAAELTSGHHDEAAGDSDHHPASPAPEKQQVRSAPLVTTVTERQMFGSRPGEDAELIAAAAASAHRSYISLGALRCDQDVGMQRLLIATFRI